VGALETLAAGSKALRGTMSRSGISCTGPVQGFEAASAGFRDSARGLCAVNGPLMRVWAQVASTTAALRRAMDEELDSSAAEWLPQVVGSRKSAAEDEAATVGVQGEEVARGPGLLDGFF
jgi:hypothetical protein